MVLDHEIQQGRGAFLAGAVEGLAEHALFQVAENRGQAVITVPGKKVAGFSPIAQFTGQGIQGSAGFIHAQHTAGRAAPRRHAQRAFVIVLEQAPGACIVEDQADHFLTDVGDQLLSGQGLAEQLHGLLQLGEALPSQTMLVEAVGLGQVFAEDADGPLAEARGAPGTDPLADGYTASRL